jgi:hypothetical protein
MKRLTWERSQQLERMGHKPEIHHCRRNTKSASCVPRVTGGYSVGCSCGWDARIASNYRDAWRWWRAHGLRILRSNSMRGY